MADRRTHTLLAAAIGLSAALAGVAFSQAQQQPATAAPAVPEGPAFDDFGLIVQRNIFDPNRVPPPPPRDPNAPPRATPVPTQTIDLLGTWVLSENKVAFVNGDPADNDGEAKAGEEIVGFKVASISTDGVELAKNDAKLTWPVGSHLVKRGEGEWEIEAGLSGAAGGGNVRQRNNNGNNNDNNGGGRRGRNSDNNNGGGRTGRNRGGNGDSPAAVRTPTPPPSDDAVRRLMEKRRLELEGRGGGAAPATPQSALPAGERVGQFAVPAEAAVVRRTTRVNAETGEQFTNVTIGSPGEEGGPVVVAGDGQDVQVIISAPVAEEESPAPPQEANSQ